MAAALVAVWLGSVTDRERGATGSLGSISTGAVGGFGVVMVPVEGVTGDLGAFSLAAVGAGMAVGRPMTGVLPGDLGMICSGEVMVCAHVSGATNRKVRMSRGVRNDFRKLSRRPRSQSL